MTDIVALSEDEKMQCQKRYVLDTAIKAKFKVQAKRNLYIIQLYKNIIMVC